MHSTRRYLRLFGTAHTTRLAKHVTLGICRYRGRSRHRPAHRQAGCLTTENETKTDSRRFDLIVVRAAEGNEQKTGRFNREIANNTDGDTAIPLGT